MLVAAQLSLSPLAKGEATPTNAEARRIVGDACELLHDALANLVEVTKDLPGFPLGNAEPSAGGVGAQRDLRISARSDNEGTDVARPAERCALTQPLWRLVRNVPQFETILTYEQLDRLRRCANGNTLRFEAEDIVAALVAAGYATEGVGRVVTVTAEGRRYLASHPA
jgi:hypothetical protein